MLPSPEHRRPPSHRTMSYAEVAASGPRQSSKEAAAPQPPEIVPHEAASTASLVDVDVPSVHTVSSGFPDHDVKTQTQADRHDREAAARNAQPPKRDATARSADSWLARQCADLPESAAAALALANVAAVVGLSSYLGYKAWGLYDRGGLDWKTAGAGLGILAAVGAVESLIGGYLCRGKKKDSP